MGVGGIRSTTLTHFLLLKCRTIFLLVVPLILLAEDSPMTLFHTSLHGTQELSLVPKQLKLMLMHALTWEPFNSTLCLTAYPCLAQLLRLKLRIDVLTK